MRVAFVQSLWDEFQGPLLLAELIEGEGHEVRFFLESRDWFPKLAAWHPQVVGLSLIAANSDSLLGMARRIKTELPDPPLVVMGGPYPTFFPESIANPDLDAIARGECETTFAPFLARIEGKRLPTDVPNFTVKSDGEVHANDLAPLVEDLDSLPIPKRRLYDEYRFLRDAPHKRFMASRGCPFNCSYCFNQKYRELLKGKGPYLRRRSVEHLLAEVEYVRDRFGFRTVEFFDDVFTLDKKWFLEFAREFKRRINVPYIITTHSHYLDAEIADALRDSGARRGLFGIESGSQRVKREIMKRRDSNDEVRARGALLRERGLRFQTFNIVGMPTETLEEAFETLHLNQEIKAHYGWCTIAQPYVGTRLAQLCVEKGWLDGSRPIEDAINSSWHNTSIIKSDHQREIVNLHKFFGLAASFPALEPLVRRLIKWPPNPLFRLLHQFFFGYHLITRYKIGPWYTLRMFLKYRHQY
jgi:anaerobic magnesium-protoporphyrin IX monomethyl ester cyclase